jgi:hypothetical protein
VNAMVHPFAPVAEAAPHSTEAEQSVLGALLLGNSGWSIASDTLTAGDFHIRHHGLLFTAIGTVVKSGLVPDMVTVHAALDAMGRADQCGGLKYLNELSQSVPSAAGIRSYARIVLEKSVARTTVADLSNLQGRTVEQVMETGLRRLAATHADTGPKVHTAKAFLEAFRPIETIIEGLPIPRGGVTAITGMTGSGKTTICAAIELALLTGKPLAGRNVSKGAVLVLAGENPDDYAMHLLASMQDAGLTTDELDGLFVVPGVFALANGLPALQKATAGRKLAAVIVDTSVAFNGRGDENGNLEQHDHAVDLRQLATLPGNPAVLVLCHPKLNPTKDTLFPRGGGAFMNEIDANLTVWKDPSGIHALHWCGKIRGASFDPINFEMVNVELAGHRDARGNAIHSVAARHVPDERADAMQAKTLDDENVLLLAMWRNSGASVADLATKCGWTSGTGKPQKSRVARLIETLSAQKLIFKNRSGSWHLTPQGQKAAEEVR